MRIRNAKHKYICNVSILNNGVWDLKESFLRNESSYNYTHFQETYLVNKIEIVRIAFF